ncbi:hypothetical protein ACJVDH_20970 [Pedobacter sp. AW1-32]|uniref:hypothetical protein n=1 Tax=Pedobacter sp. AW1-32 TaxID=3383026 RepID=UPI003FF06F20
MLKSIIFLFSTVFTFSFIPAWAIQAQSPQQPGEKSKNFYFIAIGKTVYVGGKSYFNSSLVMGNPLAKCVDIDGFNVLSNGSYFRVPPNETIIITVDESTFTTKT